MKHWIAVYSAVLLAMAFVASASGLQAEPKAKAQNVEVEGTSSSARFALELSREVNFNVFALANPYRVVVDLPEIEFQLPADEGTKREGLIKAFRFGLFSSGKSRIVIDVGGPVSIVEPYVLPAIGNQPARLEIGLKRTNREDFMRDYALNGLRTPPETSSNPQPASIAELLTPKKNTAKPVIVIDPGHGGVDPGTRGGGTVVEKDIVLAFGRRLRDSLEDTGAFEVLMTREKDVFVPLRDRREFARHHNASLFISVHADSVRQGHVRGATIYTLSDDASDAVAAALAAKENKADLIAGIALDDVSNEVTDILLDLAQRETNNLSADFANLVVGELNRKVRLNRNPRRSASFVVLKAHDVPSVLLELGYLSNGSDAESLRSSDWRDKAAGLLSGAVKKYFRTEVAKRP